MSDCGGFTMCRNCGRRFKADADDAAFCTDACREAYASRHAAVCPECGADFVKQWPSQHFCSPECLRVKKRRDSRERWRRGRVAIPDGVCRECGAVFERRSSWQVYCSPECRTRGALHMAHVYRQTQNERRDTMRVCVDCGKPLGDDPKCRAVRCPECWKRHFLARQAAGARARYVAAPRHPCIDCGRPTYNRRCYICAEKWRVKNHVAPKAKAIYSERGGYI